MLAALTVILIIPSLLIFLNLNLSSNISYPLADKYFDIFFKFNYRFQIFRMRSRGFPGVVGAIDGCHIPIKQPPGNANDYYNRKEFHSIILQGKIYVVFCQAFLQ